MQNGDFGSRRPAILVVSSRAEAKSRIAPRELLDRGPKGCLFMAHRTGSADLPLHGGRVPRWLAERMAKLGAVICEAIVHHYGRDELLRRLAHPFWFQSFGAVMGMDWHSSGITTSVIGALKRGLAPLSGELGLHVCGGRGAHSRKTPHELVAIGERVGLDGAALAQASRLVAKVDSAAVQDGFELYLHGFIVADDGNWVVVQQGMNERHAAGAPLSLAVGGAEELRRRAACGDRGRGQGDDRQPDRPPRRSVAARPARPAAVARPGPDRARGRARWRAERARRPQPAAAAAAASDHAGASRRARRGRRSLRRLHGDARGRGRIAGPPISPSCCWCPASARARCGRWRWWRRCVHGAPCRFSDPARFSLAHGGKDRHPFPVPTRGL